MSEIPTHIEIDVTLAPEGALRCRLSVTDPSGLSGPWVWAGAHSVDLARLDEERRGLSRALRRWMRRASPQGAPPAPEALIAHGRLLYDLILPEPVKQVLGRQGRRPSSAAPVMALAVDASLLDVPWALLHDGQGWLGARWAMGVRAFSAALDDVTRAQPAQDAESMLVLADPAGDLPAARVEGEALVRLAAEGPEGLRCALRGGRMTVVDALRVFRGHRVLHFAGHADAEPGGWRFADGHLTAQSLRPLSGEGVPALVFANACRSDEGGLSQALLRAGVRHWIGTRVDLPDLPGADFARWFYEALWAGASVGESLRRARARAMARGWPVWAAYRLLGDPRGRYFEARGGKGAQGPAPGVRRGLALAVRHPRAPCDGAEAVAAWRAERRRAFEAEIGALGGWAGAASAQVDLALFGWPISYENDLGRATRAARALERRWPGATVVVEAGPIATEGALVTGPAIMAAERACWALPPGAYGLEALGRTLNGRGLLGPWVPWSALGEGGRAAPLLAGGPLGGASRAGAPLIGRVAELGQMEQLARRVLVEGGSGAVTLMAPAGMGKTRLLDALVARVDGQCLVVRGHNPAHGEGGDLTALAEVLCALSGVSPAADEQSRRAHLERLLSGLDAAEQAPLAMGVTSIDALLAQMGAPETRAPALMDRLGVLGAVMGLGAGVEAHGEAAGADGLLPVTFRRVIEGVARETPILVAIEDAHWMGPEGLAVVDELLTGLPRVMVVITARPEWMARARPGRALPGHITVELGPLDRRAAEAVARSVWGPGEAPLGAEQMEALLSRAEGNPLFLRELALAEGAPELLPLTVEGVILARVDRQPPLLQRVLQGASVLGRVFWREAVARLLGKEDEIGEALAQLEAGRFVSARPDLSRAGMEAWGFNHGLMQEVVYRGLGERSRRAWHGRAALWLAEEVAQQGPDLWPRVAQHHAAAGDSARAAEAWLKAGELAMEAVAPAEATRAFEAALVEDDAIGGHLPPAARAAAEMRLAELVHAAGDRARAAALLDAALAHEPEAAPALRAERLRRRAQLEEGGEEAARALLLRAWALVEEAPPEGALAAVVARASVARDLAWLDHDRGAYAEAAAQMEALLELLTRARDAHPTLGAHALLKLAGTVHNALGVVAYATGAYDRADQQYRCALVAFEDAGEERSQASTYNNLGILAEKRGEYEKAVACHQRGLRLKAALGDRPGLARSYNNLGTLAWLHGDYKQARDYFLESIRIKARAGVAGLALGYANLGEVLLVLGELDEARARLEEAISLCEVGRGPGYLLPDAWRILADVHLAADRLVEAERAAVEAIEVSRAQQDPSREGAAHRARGEALGRMGRLDDAEIALAQALGVLSPLGDSVELGQVYAARGRLRAAAGVEGAAESYARARAMFQALGAGGELARLDAGGVD